MPLDHPDCPLCDGPASPWLDVPGDFARPDDAATYHLFWCDPCLYGFMAPRPTPQQAASFYDIDDYYTHRAGAQQPCAPQAPTLAQRLREHIAWRMDTSRPMLDSLLDPRRGQKLEVCDIGCGSGLNLRGMLDAGHHVTGVELDPQACKVARSQGVEVYAGSAEGLPEAVRQRRFDIVFMCHVLEHTLDPAAAVRNAAALLKPTGLFVCEVPNNACLSLERAGIAWPFLDVPRHVNFFTPTSLVGICRMADLAVSEVEYFGFNRLVQKHWIDAEAQRWDFFRPRVTNADAMPPRSSVTRAWALLAQCVLAPAQRKYDSVRVITRPAAASPRHHDLTAVEA